MTLASDDQLREMAQHRGLKLLRSRRRKPGVGDYGKYGLTDESGIALLGVGENGLTASAQDIEDYLRASELGTWKQSAQGALQRPPPPRKSPAPEPRGEDAPVRRRSGQRSRRRTAPGADSSPGEKDVAGKIRPKPALRLVRQSGPAQEKLSRPTEIPRSRNESSPVPVPDPVLVVRPAATADSEELAALLNQLSGLAIEPAEVKTNLAMVRKAKAGLIVAQLGRVVGCCQWSIIPSVHRGALGRLIVIVVDKAHRRRGIATAMLAAAQKALAKAGCMQVEALSDISINNSHNFFRSLGFEQTSYRFIRDVGE
jgi:ribosomal protein S18 acetylase RimI-like enzyme